MNKGGNGMRHAFWAALFGILALASPAIAEDFLAQGDALFLKGGLDNFRQSIEMYSKAAAADPDSYEANWKLARSDRWYAEQAKRDGLENYKDICAQYGKEGMKYGEKAIQLNPGGVEGHYYYGLSVGIYSDGVSILTALKEGLKGKTQSSFEKAYELDKTFNTGGPMLALGRFWFVLPWPMNDKKKSLMYLREAYKQFPDNIEGMLYLGEVLLDAGKDSERPEAEALLQKVAASDNPYFSAWAKRLLR
jgi:tetratricopeptide (TPR) repeat protein